MRTRKDFIQGEIFAHQFDIVEALLNNSSFPLSREEDVNTPLVYDYEGEQLTEGELREKREELEESLHEEPTQPRNDVEIHMEIDYIGDLLRNGPDDMSPTSWLLVSEVFYKALKERNQVTVQYGTSYWWGRVTGNAAAWEDEVCIDISNAFGIEG